MGKYTVYEDAWIDAAIQRHIDLAVAELKTIKGLRSILLVGGFGRAEGSVKILDGKMEPLNDYDLYIVVDNRVPDKTMEALNKRIEQKAGTPGFSLVEHSDKAFYFDIRQLKFSEISRLLPFIKYYEMKHASYIVYGEDVRPLIPDYKSTDLPLSEGLRFVFNRMSSITMWTPVKHLCQLHVEQWEKDVLLYDISKAYLAMATALTQLAGVYQPTYRGCLESLRTVYQEKFAPLEQRCPGLLARIEYYTQLKLRPEYGRIRDYAERWFEARDHLLKVAEFFLKEAFGIEKIDEFWPAICSHYFKPYLQAAFYSKFKIRPPRVMLELIDGLSQAYLTFTWVARISKYRQVFYPQALKGLKDPGMRIFAALPFLMRAITPSGDIDEENLQQSIRLLGLAYPLGIYSDDKTKVFDDLLTQYVDAWKLYFFQKIC